MEADPSDGPFPPEVGNEEAEKVISQVMQGPDACDLAKPRAPDLARGIFELRSFYEEIEQCRRFGKYDDCLKIYEAVVWRAKSLEETLLQYNNNQAAWYFHVNFQLETTGRSDEDMDNPPENIALDHLARLIKEFRFTMARTKEEQRKHGGDLWYEHVEQSATAWIHGIGLPELFVRNFGQDYQLPGAGGTSPAYRFANAVITVAGLKARTSLSNMRKLERSYRARRASRSGQPSSA